MFLPQKACNKNFFVFCKIFLKKCRKVIDKIYFFGYNTLAFVDR